VEQFLAQGVQIRTAAVHAGRRETGRLSFSTLPGRYPYILALPQVRTVEILRQELTGRVPILRGHRYLDHSETPQSVRVRVKGYHQHFEPRLLIGCDGSRSDVRAAAGISTETRVSPYRFIMGDFQDNTGWTSDAHLFFTRSGPVESFPLPKGGRRWIVRTRAGAVPDPSFLVSEVQRITGRDIADAGLRWTSQFRITQVLARRYAKGHTALCGDSIHAISPIGGQGMNTGFADAVALAGLVPLILGNVLTEEQAWLRYQRYRGAAVRTAARRGWGWVWFGTRKGPFLNVLRGGLVASLLASPLRHKLARDFAMISLPGSRRRRHTPRSSTPANGNATVPGRE
jgi:2-polyprenyl-6-methoxyphenol hydroxylase-like FAD-dependent oxidoreductase